MNPLSDLSCPVSRNSCARGARAFTLIDMMLVVVILGIIAALVIPKYSNAADQAREAAVASQLQTVRHQIELYNLNNPSDPFDPLNPGGAAAWDQLVQNEYIQTPPENPLQSNLSTVAALPSVGVAWAWIDLGDGTRLYAVDANANFFDMDGDGNPD